MMRRMITGIALFIIYLGSALTHLHSRNGADGINHVCVHDSKFKDHKPKVMEDISKEEYNRLLQLNPSAVLTGGSTSGFTTVISSITDGWHPLRIFVDYSYSNQMIGSQASLNSKYQMSIRLIESVKSYFMNTLDVNFAPEMRFLGGSCYENMVPQFNKPIDLYITIYPENDPNTEYFAAATPCYLSVRDGRPTIGAYILNFAFLTASPLNEYLYFSTFAHEFTHILGFSNDLFSYYIDSSGRRRAISEVVTDIAIGSETFTAIKLPEVLAYAKTYFNCPSILGVPLENNGGDGSAGSHWEKLFLPQEYMNPTVENPGILSEFTLTLLKATGWYHVNTLAAQNYDWGKNSGCGVFQICPQNAQGYCSLSQVGTSLCSSEWYSKGICLKDSIFTSNCPMKRSSEHTCLMAGVFEQDPTEYYGPGSRCLNYQNSGPKCHSVQCISGSLEIKVGTTKITCTINDNGAVKSAGNDTLICPDVNDFCSELATKCTNDCNAKGLCISGGICQCYTGWSGSDCSTSVPVNHEIITAAEDTKSANLFGLALPALASVFALFL